MKHTMLTFRLHRNGVALVALGSVLLGGLLFGAGWLLGQRRAMKPSPPAVPSVPSLPKEKQQSAAKDHIEGEAFALRVGTFADEEAAKAYVKELAARGHKPSVLAVTTQGGVVLHTVRIGRYASRDEASRAASELERKEGISSAVVSAGSAGGATGG